MKILWVGPNFLHPTTKGGQIRSLHTLMELHKRHEIHYVTFDHSGGGEGPARASEYSSQCQAYQLRLPSKGTPSFFAQLWSGLFSSTPVSIRRFSADEMRRYLDDAVRDESFDCIVCDFLAVAHNFPTLNGVTLFEHNVESEIWRRRLSQASVLSRSYLRLQTSRMINFEKQACHESDMVIAVSEKDSETMQSWFGLSDDDVRTVSTGVDIDYFRQSSNLPSDYEHDLVFVGSMDWSPNEDAMRYFINEVLPLIHRVRPSCSVAIVGRSPSVALRRLAQAESGITVTGTVPDVRPYLWGARAAIVPIRIGGGTRLKIYEAIAAGTPVISTTIGAEGLALEDDDHILLADSATAFAEKICNLLDDPSNGERLSTTALQWVAAHYSWPTVAQEFEAHIVEAAERRRSYLRAAASTAQ